MYCDKCGYNNNNTATHCLGCGAPLRSDVVGSKIICTDVNTGKIYESALIKQDLMWLSPGMEVGVMVDRANPDNYWVLTPKPNTYMPYTQNG